MPTIFTRIIDGEIPGRFVWKDDRAVAFLSIAPMMPGHTLVVPRDEVDHWIDLDPDLAAHLFQVAQWIGQRPAARCGTRARIGVMHRRRGGAPHAHPRRARSTTPHELSFAHVDASPDADALDDAAEPHPRRTARRSARPASAE